MDLVWYGTLMVAVLVNVYEYVYVNRDYGLEFVECEVKWCYEVYA